MDNLKVMSQLNQMVNPTDLIFRESTTDHPQSGIELNISILFFVKNSCLGQLQIDYGLL